MTQQTASTATIRCSQCGLVAEVPLEPWSDFDVILQKLETASCDHLRELFAYALAGGSDEAPDYTDIDLDGALLEFRERQDTNRAIPLKKAAATLGVSVKTLKRWRAAGKLGHDKMWQQQFNGRWYVETSALKHIIARRSS